MHTEHAEISWDGLDLQLRALRAYLARRCHDANEADDVVQETLLRAARFRARLSDERNLRPWILRIAATVLRDHVRRERRQQRVHGSEALLAQMIGREEEPGGWESEDLLSIEGQAVRRESLLEELELALAESEVEERRALARLYGAGLCCEAGEPVCASEPPMRRKDLLYRARRKLQRRLTSRVRCVVLGADEPLLQPRGTTHTGRGRGAPAVHPESGAARAQRV